MPLRALLAVLVLGVFGRQALSADVVGYAEAFNVLYSVNLTARTATQIGGAGTINGQIVANIEGLTFSPDGTLYAVSDAGAVKTLLTIDKSTGLATAVGVLDLGAGSTTQLDLGLAFTCDGKLWMSASTGQVWQVGPASASAALIGSSSVQITGLAARGNVLIGAGGQGDNNLYRIDTTTAAASLIGSYGSKDYITTTSPGFDSTGQLWAILDYVPPQPGNTAVAAWSDLASLSATSGALTNLGSITPPTPIDTKTPTYQNLYQIGLKGLAIPNSVCAVAAGVSATPALDMRGLIALIAMLVMLGGTTLRSRRPSC